jgi:hypothetical protein
MYENAQYVSNNTIIQVDINGLTHFVPLDSANMDYVNLMALKDSGNWPAAEIEGYAFDSQNMCYHITAIYKFQHPDAPDTISIG